MTVTKPGNEAGDFSDTDRVGIAVALGLKGEIDGDGVGRGPQDVLADGVPPAVPAGLGDVAAAGSGGDEASEFDGAAFKVVLAPAEGLADLGEDRLPGGVCGQLVGPAADDRRGGGE